MQRQTNQVTELIARIELSNRDRTISAIRSMRHKQRASSRNEPVVRPLGTFGDQSPITLASGLASAIKTPKPTSVPLASTQPGRSSSSGGQTALRPG
eukprot:12040314-Karenia_brevis.AAC.1